MVRTESAPATTIEAIQAGDRELRNLFIEAHLPFIRRETRRFTGRFDIDGDDEFALALEAFDRAIDAYRPDRGAPFEPFARVLIRNRLLDDARRRRLAPPMISLSEEDGEDGPTVEDRLADERSGRIQEDLEFEESIAGLESALARFGLSLSRLSGRLPKHDDCRRLCIRMARSVTGDESLYQRMLSEGRLPGAELSRRCGVPLKTVERNRGSVVLLALLLRSDLRLIHAYIAGFEKEENP
jgi:RNA polymerase sigma factor